MLEMATAAASLHLPAYNRLQIADLLIVGARVAENACQVHVFHSELNYNFLLPT